ncbi:MAG: TolC family protein [Gammaproteobacteria bacterium]|nr:TolC family protein [Gammaproteobacteria bacterium]
MPTLWRHWVAYWLVTALGLLALSHPAPARAESGIGLRDVLSLALQMNVDTQVSQQAIRSAQGQLQQAQGRFDPVLGSDLSRAHDNTPLGTAQSAGFQALGINPPSNQVIDATAYGVSAQRTLMNGMQAGAGFSVAAAENSLEQKLDIPSQLIGKLAFTLRVPLARNAGRATVGAEVDASNAESAAARAELEHTNASILLQTTSAFWLWLASARQLAISEAAEQRLEDLVHEMQRLIEAGETPRADIELVLASRAERRAQRITAQQVASEARVALANLMGLPPARSAELGQPAQDFPKLRALPATQDPAPLVERALTRRADLEAARQRNEAAHYRANAAVANLKPQVDLDLRLSYTGLAEDTSQFALDDSLENLTGPSVGASLSVQWPWANLSAKGTELTAAAGWDAASIRQRDLGQTIAYTVPVAWLALMRAGAQLQEGAEAVNRYTITLKNEQTKRRLGKSTVIDLINIEDRLNTSLQNEIGLRQQYAIAIARLRFELGTLVRREGDQFEVAVAALLGSDPLGD